MKVKELREFLDRCKPDAEVRLHLSASMYDREPKEQDDGLEYGFTPVVNVTWNNRECSGLADHLNIELPAECRTAPDSV